MKPLAADALSSRTRVELIGRVLKHDGEGMPEVISKLQSTRNWALADSKQRQHLFPRSWPELLQRTTVILWRPAALQWSDRAVSPPCFFYTQLSGLGSKVQAGLWSDPSRSALRNLPGVTEGRFTLSVTKRRLTLGVTKKRLTLGVTGRRLTYL